MKPIPFEIEIKVTQDDLDDLHHVNNIRYIEWALNISELHWKTKTPTSIRQQLGWVVLEHHLYYKKAAKKDEVLKLKTWIDHYSGVKCTRKIQLKNLDGQLLFEAKTLWCLIDLKHQKPARITAEIVEPYFIV